MNAPDFHQCVMHARAASHQAAAQIQAAIQRELDANGVLPAVMNIPINIEVKLK